MYIITYNNVLLELNEMDCREQEKYVSIEGDPAKSMSVVVRENFADDVLVVGPRYQLDDVKCSWSNFLGFNTSGVLCKILCYKR